MKKKKLGEVLRERGHISPSDLAAAVAGQQGRVGRLGELLLEREVVAKADLVSAIEEVTRIKYVDCRMFSPDKEILDLIPRDLAIRCCVLPLTLEGKNLVVAMGEPQNVGMISEIGFQAGKNILPRFAFRNEILEAITRHYGEVENAPEGPAATLGIESVEDGYGRASEMEFVSTSARQANREAFREIQAEIAHKRTPAVKVVSEIIMEASKRLASDIHIEPQGVHVVIRIRVDGVLRDLKKVPSEIQLALASRIKILADMDIGERRAPQDGRFLVRMGARQLDLRVSSLPTQYGEKIVIRLLDAGASLLDLGLLSMPEAVERTLREMLSLPQGMLLVCGPTGSGKSTTLYAAINLIRKPAVNIVTVEDPIEYVLPGINQVQVNNKAGLTFASCLRSIMRQDPNVMMVGEMRDLETTEIAMKAAQTGHLVLSTLHTNDAISAVNRLVDMGVPGFMIGSSVSAVVAQRLVRRLCECHQQVPCTPEDAERLASMGLLAPVDTVSIPVGCDLCDQTGYRGRIGVYEILSFNDAVREAVRMGETSDVIRIAAREMGMTSMQDDALYKILQGITSVAEVARVVPVQTAGAAKCSSCHRELSRTFKFCPYCGVPRQETVSRKIGRSPKATRDFEEVKKH
jgi:type IV pilus assembly protein PilB